MSEQSEEDAIYNLMVDEATGDLKPKVDKVKHLYIIKIKIKNFFILTIPN